MREFFRGRKRKLGCLTLLMACIFVASWVRSLRIKDEVVIQHEEPTHVFVTHDGYFRWTSYYGLSLPAFHWQSFPVGARGGVSKVFSQGEPVDGVNIEWKWQWRQFGFHFGKGLLFANSQWPVGVSAIPHRSLVIPLSLLSAWLLLSKPRAAVKKNATPPPA